MATVTTRWLGRRRPRATAGRCCRGGRRLLAHQCRRWRQWLGTGPSRQPSRPGVFRLRNRGRRNRAHWRRRPCAAAGAGYRPYRRHCPPARVRAAQQQQQGDDGCPFFIFYFFFIKRQKPVSMPAHKASCSLTFFKTCKLCAHGRRVRH